MTTPSGAYEALVQIGREALREGGSGMNSTYEEDAAMVLAAVLPVVADLLREHDRKVRRSEVERPRDRYAVFATDLASDWEWAAQVVEQMSQSSDSSSGTSGGSA